MNFTSKISGKKVRAHYFYDTDLFLKPMNYDGFKEYSTDKLHDRIKSHLVGWTLELKNLKITYTAFDYERKNLKKDFFEVPSGVVLKEQ